MKKFILLISAFLQLGLFAQNVSTVKNGYIYIQKEERQNDKEWKLVWHDEFDSTSIDTTKWTKITMGKPDWKRHMTTDDECYEIKNGKLYLKGIINKDTTGDPREVLTGGLWSKGKFAFQYGKIEIRAKLECAQGAWPAIWMLAEERIYGAYPRNGEIDIMEHLNYDKKVYQTVHSYYTRNLKQDKNPPHFGTAKIKRKKFNTYGLEWYPDKLVFTVNGKKTFVYPKVESADKTQWPFDQPFFVIIDQQLGGRWVGDIRKNDLPVNMIIDWVRVYQ